MVAVGEVIIYSGAIVVLFLFVVTLLPSGGRELGPTGGRLAAGWIAGGSLVVALAAALAAGGLPAPAAKPDLGVLAVGRSLFGPLLLAFELTAPLLPVATFRALAIRPRPRPIPRTA